MKTSEFKKEVSNLGMGVSFTIIGNLIIVKSFTNSSLLEISTYLVSSFSVCSSLYSFPDHTARKLIDLAFKYSRTPISERNDPDPKVFVKEFIQVYSSSMNWKELIHFLEEAKNIEKDKEYATAIWNWYNENSNEFISMYLEEVNK